MGTVKPEDDMKQDLNDSGCVQDASMIEGYRGQAGLLELSDDVLLYLLSFCSPMDLKALGFACTRLARLICDRTLWQRVNARGVQIGSDRLRWFMKHCFSVATTELYVTGYANRDSRCLGIQDLTWSPTEEGGLPRLRHQAVSAGVDVEHFLLRMWYPHLPRYAVSPRWPDKEEALTHIRAHKFLKNGGPPAAKNDVPENMDITDNEKPGKPGVLPDTPGPSQYQRASEVDPKPGPSESKEMQLRDSEHPDNCYGPYFTFNDKLMKDLSKKCPHLSTLFLEYCNIDYRETNIRCFPPKLKKLSLRGTRCYNLPLNISYLCKIQDQMPLLEYLNVSECEWFEPASLMPLSKLPVLKELYLRDCMRLTECVAYASLATRYGFRQLRVLDVRGSPVSDSEVSAVGWLPHLEELYCAPGNDFRSIAEHTHAWTERLELCNELDTWEAEEPEYFESKTPEPESADEEEVKPEPSDSYENGTSPWWSHERRIIVIQPTTDEEDDSPATVRLRTLGLQVEPGPSGAGPSAAGPSAPGSSAAGPSGTKRANIDNVLDLVKRPRLTREDEQEELENERPVITAQDCPRLNRIQVLNRPILIGRHQPINRPVQPEGLLPNDLQRNINLPQANVRRDGEPPHAYENLQAGVPAQPEVTIQVLKPQPEVGVQPLASAPPQMSVHTQAGVSRVNVPHISVQTQAGEPQVNVPENDLPPQVDEQPQPGVSNEPLPQNVVHRDVNVTVEVAPPAGNQPLAGNPPPDGNPPSAGNPPQPRRGHHFVNPQQHHSVNVPPHSANPPHFRHVPHCVHAPQYVQRPPPEPLPIFVPPELSAINAGQAHVYAPYVNGPQAVIIPGNVAPINAGPQAHLLMNPNRAPRNVPPYDNQSPPYHNRLLPDVELPDRGPLLDLYNEYDGNPRQDLRPRFVRLRRNNLRDHMHVDLDIHHQNQAHQSHAHLVTDSAILRFGRADNDDINYIHIARLGDGASEQGNRPSRSSLRILSVTGYSNITNRSLQHLATAAPNLTSIDFSQTSVTQSGVDIFKAIRPNCEVTYSDHNCKI